MSSRNVLLLSVEQPIRGMDGQGVRYHWHEESVESTWWRRIVSFAKERNDGPAEEPLWSTHRTDKSLFRQYLVNKLDPEMWCILSLT
jgi:hypothetical protein